MCVLTPYPLSQCIHQPIEKAKVCSYGQNIIIKYKIVGGRRWTERSRTVRNPPRGRQRKESIIRNNWKDLTHFGKFWFSRSFWVKMGYLIRTVPPLWRWVIASMMRRMTRSVCGLICLWFPLGIHCYSVPVFHLSPQIHSLRAKISPKASGFSQCR